MSGGIYLLAHGGYGPGPTDPRLANALAEGTISMKEYALYMDYSPEELDQVGALHPVDEETEKFEKVPHPRAAPTPEDFEQALAGLEAGMRFMVRAGIPADNIKNCIYQTKAWGAFMGLYSGAIPAAAATQPRPAPRPKPTPPPAPVPIPEPVVYISDEPSKLIYPLLQKKKTEPFGGDGPHYGPVSTIPQGPPPPPSTNPKPAPVQRSFNYASDSVRERECELFPGFASAMGPEISAAELGKMLESEGVLPESPTKPISVEEQAKKIMAAADEKIHEAEAERERAVKLICSAGGKTAEPKPEPQPDIKHLALDEFVFIGPDGEEHPIMFLKSKKK